jgi:hypothetical protein
MRNNKAIFEMAVKRYPFSPKDFIKSTIPVEIVFGFLIGFLIAMIFCTTGHGYFYNFYGKPAYSRVFCSSKSHWDLSDLSRTWW